LEITHRAADPKATEPAENFLRTVRKEHRSERQPRGEQGE
jgi:hypothetical protein